VSNLNAIATYRDVGQRRVWNVKGLPPTAIFRRGRRREWQDCHTPGQPDKMLALESFKGYRTQSGLSSLEHAKMVSIWHDFRYGLRMLGKNPGLPSLAILQRREFNGAI
jgi:hypothetical protein